MSNNNINISDFVPVFNQFKNKPKDTIKYESLSFVVTVTNGYNADGAALDFSGYKPTYKELIAYDHLINKGNGTYNLTGKGFDETLKNLPQVVLKYKSQVTKLAKHLYSSNYKQACFNIWHFLTKNIKYKIDKPGYEEMRSPARAWHDRFTGIDCDCFSIFSACLLIEMNYYPHFQIVAFNNKPDYGHIYVIEKNIILDCVMKKFNQEPDNVTKKLNLMIQNVILNGPDSGIVQILMNEQKKLKEIINSGNATAAVFKELKKVKFLILCAEHEAHTHLIELMHYVDDINADGNFIYKNATINSILSHVDGLGNIESSLGEVEASEDDIDEMEDIAGILEEIEEIEETPLEGLGDLGRRHARKRAARKAKRAARKAAGKTIKQKLRRFIKKTGSTIKKVSRKIRKFNPAFAIPRAAFLGLLNLNAFNLAFKLSIGYKTQAEAEKDGMDINEWKKAVNATAKVEKFFEKTGGSIAQLRKAVKKGRYRKEAKAEKTRVKGFKGLGFAIAGAITAAGSLLAKIFGFLKKVNFKKLGRKVFNKIKGSKTDVENEIDMDNINTMNPNNPTNTTSNNSSLIWILLGGCALAFFALKK